MDNGLPTILIAARENLLNSMVPPLRLDGYVVFEGRSYEEALHVVISQSRQIHMLLADVDMDGDDVATALTPYRPEMQVLFVKANLKQEVAYALSPEAALARVRDLLKVPKDVAPGTRGTELLGLDVPCSQVLRERVAVA